MTAAEANGQKPECLLGYMKNGPTRWKSWEKLTFSKLNTIIREAKAKGRKIRAKKTNEREEIKKRKAKKSKRKVKKSKLTSK
jgi:sucrose-6-phosphate hydrolase SacC (GH32 family)